MKGRDANDRLRAGTLPYNPRDGTVPVEPEIAATGEPTEFGFRRIEDLLAEPDLELEPLWPGLVLRGALTLAAAPPKIGKTWALFAWLACLIRRLAWIGNPAIDREVRVLLVSEEPAFLVKRRARRFGVVALLDVLTLDKIPAGATWDATVAAVAARAKEIGADVVIFDTVSTLARIPDENAAPDVNRALLPLLHMARGQDVAVVAVHHVGANGRFRGSTVFEALPDVLVEVRRVGPEGSRKRSLHVRSRFEGAPELPIVVEYVPGSGDSPATYRSVATKHLADERADREAERVRRADARIAAALDAAAKSPTPWLTKAQVGELTGSPHDAGERLPRMAEIDTIQRVRALRGRGGGFVYAARGVPLPVEPARPSNSSRGQVRTSSRDGDADSATRPNSSAPATAKGVAGEKRAKGERSNRKTVESGEPVPTVPNSSEPVPNGDAGSRANSSGASPTPKGGESPDRFADRDHSDPRREGGTA